MSARVEINLNLRLDDDQTIADLDEDVSGIIAVYDEVQIHVPALELVGRGWVTEIDPEERTVTVQVDWPSLKRPSTIGLGSLMSHQGSNLRIDAGNHRLVGV